MEQFWLLRINFPPYDEVKFNEAVIRLLWSRYNRAATDYDAPEQTHCVSAVRYVLYHAMDILLPKMYVWNMCRNILDSHSFHASIVPLTDAEQGDIIFFRWWNRIKQYITHVGIQVDHSHFFHSTYGRWGVVDPITNVIDQGSIATCNILSSYTDSRGYR